MTPYLGVYAKLSQLHFNVLLFSNCREKVLKLENTSLRVADVKEVEVEPGHCSPLPLLYC